MLYKVLVNERSCHGGGHVYDLPKQSKGGTWRPGEWSPRVADPVMCESGYHLTTKPMQWLKIGMQVYVAEGRGCHGEKDDKSVFESVRLIRPVSRAVPAYWRRVEKFVMQEIPAVPWMKPDGKPDSAWKLFPTRAAAWAAAGDAAGDAAGAAAGDAAWAAAGAAAGDAAWAAARAAARAAAGAAAWAAAGDAALYARLLICPRGSVATVHVAHIKARWNVWQKGYGLYCDVNGVLYVYERI